MFLNKPEKIKMNISAVIRDASLFPKIKEKIKEAPKLLMKPVSLLQCFFSVSYKFFSLIKMISAKIPVKRPAYTNIS